MPEKCSLNRPPAVAVLTVVVLIIVPVLSRSSIAAPGDVLLTIPHPSPGPWSIGTFGNSITGVGEDILVGAPNTHMFVDGVFRRFVGTAYLFDGTTGLLRQEIPNPNPNQLGSSFGESLTSVNGKK